MWAVRHLALAAVLSSSFSAIGLPARAAENTVQVIAQDTIVRTGTASSQVRFVEVHDILSRGARTRLLVERVSNPIAVAVLFAGGKGSLRLSARGAIGRGNGNFLIRSRPYFHQRGVTTAVIDAPSDRARDLRHGFRGSAAHGTDIEAVIGHLKSRVAVPVWLVGTSRGTNSVANAAVRIRSHKPDGIVLTASMLAFNEKGDQLFDFALEKISGPVLIMHHRDDACFVTPAGEVTRLARRLDKAKPKKVILYTGGQASGNPCKGAHYHGFHGIEEEVVADLVKWIASPTP